MMVFRVWIILAVLLGGSCSASGHVSRQGEPERGVVAHLIVRGDLDTNAMADEIVNWLSKRDAADEVLAVISFDGQRARPDLATRIAGAVRSSRVPVAVHLEGRGPVSPQILLIGLASGKVTAARGVGVRGGPEARLEDLCPPELTGWRGANEKLARSVLGGRDELFLDLFVKPLGDVYLHHGDDAWTVARVRQSEKDGRIVNRIDDDNWGVDLPHEALVGLDLADDANGLGQVLRANNVRAFRRERTEIRSGLSQALAAVEGIRKGVSAEVIRLEAGVREAKTLELRDLDNAIRTMRMQIARMREQLSEARGLFDSYPELYRVTPSWAFESDADQRSKDWAKAFRMLASDVDGLSTDLDALEKP